MKLRALIVSVPLALAGTAHAASLLDIEGISKSVPACQDFYMFANERWLLTTEIPADRSTWGAASELALRNEILLKSLLEKHSRDPAGTPAGPARLALTFYFSGMDVAAIEAAGAKPLAPELTRIAAIKRPTDLPAAFARMNRLGIGAPLGIDVKQDEKDATRYLVALSQGGLGLPNREFYFTDDAKSATWRAEYQRHIGNMLVLLGQDDASARRDAEKILALETELARASMTPVEERDPHATYNPRRLPRLALEAPGLDWKIYFKAVGVASPGKLNVMQPAFARAVGALARKAPVADWQAYLRWHLLRTSAPMMSKAFEQEHFRFFDGVLDGKEAMPPRHRKVVQNVGGRYGEERLGEGLSQLYVAEAFPPAAKARADALVNNLKLALKDRLEQLEWMSPATRKKAQEKLAAMNIKIGYPARWRDYASLKLAPGDYLANTWRANEFDLAHKLAKLGKPVDRGAWEMGAYIVNAYYNPNLNEIVFPAAILQPPYFNAAADDALNYGGIGMVIGHEITHGFDDTGRQYDAKGNLKDWWTAADAKRYAAVSEAIVKQYDALEGVEGLKVNGKLTLGENISDVGGLKIAFLAHQKALAAGGAAARAAIDGYTPEQRFFLSFAQSWRQRWRPEVERVRLTSDPHSPPRHRVRGPLAHLPEFAAAFACKPGDAALVSAGGTVNIW